VILFTYVCPKGELAKGTEKFLYKRLGIKADLNSKDYVEYFGRYRIVKMRSWDVPLVTSLIGNYGISGKDIYYNSTQSNLRLLENLDYGYSEVWIMGNKRSLDEYEEPIRVGSPYETLANRFFTEKDYRIIMNPLGESKKVEGSWEALIELELVDVVVDVIDSGNTSKINGLNKLEKILDSNAVLIERCEQ